jgi:phytoene dehydrogenase-like protein
VAESTSAGAIPSATTPSSSPTPRARQQRYDAFFAYLQAFADRLGISIFEPPPTLQHLVRNLTRLEDQEAFSRILFGNIRDLMDEFELAPETQALIAPLAVVGGQVAPSTPGSPFNLMMRPLSLASLKSGSAADPRLIPLRGSTGLPVGGMGAITDALSASVRAHGGEVMVGKPGRHHSQCRRPGAGRGHPVGRGVRGADRRLGAQPR